MAAILGNLRANCRKTDMLIAMGWRKGRRKNA
jgi:hypothetical protein